MKKFTARLSILALISVLIFILSCSTLITNTYRTEYVGGCAGDIAMKSVRSFQDSGKITADQRIQINKYGLIYYNSYLVAVDGLKAYYKGQNATGQEILTTVVESLISNWMDFANLVNSIVPGTVPGALTLKGTNSVGQKYTITIKKLPDGTITILIQIGAVILQYAIQQAMSIINALEKAQITLDDIDGLKGLMKPPEQY